MANPVSTEELSVALQRMAWDVAQAEIDALPPYLADNELTIDRFYEKNKETISKNEARELLEKMVEAGKLDKQERRSGRGGGHVFAYVAKESQKPSLGSE